MIKSTTARVFVITSFLGLAASGCGSPMSTDHDEKRSAAPASTSEGNAKTSADANAVRKGEVGQEPKVESPAVEEQCAGIALHADGVCDEQDDKIADEQAQKEQEKNRHDSETGSGSGSKGDTASGSGSETPKPVTPAPAPAPAPAPSDPNIVEFHIKAGTGKAPWNTADATVVAKVGQTVRVFNDDTVTHRMHTNGAPCPHGDNFAPGTSADCKITKALDPVKTPGQTYDHIAGPTATFFLKATP